MPDLDKKPWTDILPLLREEVLPILVIVIAAYIALRLARLFVHGVVKALLDREATEGTAQELSAVELKKRMNTIDTLGSNSIEFLIVAIAGLMILGQLGFNIGPAIAGLGIVGIADRLRRPEPRAGLPQRRPDPDREPVRQRRCRSDRRRRRHRRGLHVAADDVA